MMGKASKKVKKQTQKNTDARVLRQCRQQEEELAVAFKAEEYAKVLELLAELIKAKDIKPDLLYKGAYSYFMLGDYERAAQWVNNTLNYDVHSVDARILLARLCFMQDRQNDGLAIYEFIVTNYSQTITQEQKEQIIDSSEYYARRDADNLRENYPNLAALLKISENKDGDVVSVVPENTMESAGGALSALQRLKAKLQAVQDKHEQTSTSAEKAASLQDDVSKNTEINTVDQQIAEIQSRTCSMREKIQLFNKFAAAGYMNADYSGAAAYLKAALQLDDSDGQTIRNLAMVYAAIGDTDMAQALVSKMPEVDFVLLHLLGGTSRG